MHLKSKVLTELKKIFLQVSGNHLKFESYTMHFCKQYQQTYFVDSTKEKSKK